MRLFAFLVFFAVSLTACKPTPKIRTGQTQNKESEQPSGNNRNFQVDTSKTAIISFDKNWRYPFDNSFEPATLTQEELNRIESLLVACVTDYNNSLDRNNKGWSIDLKKYNYRKQIIAVTNKKGEKEALVNCFCDTWDSDKWKTEQKLPGTAQIPEALTIII